ncbi:MAG TPA: DUF4332 domain-containing protein, partial [Candidatus Limnocylindrales bacterium]|nr:DUF4332 domain-containing protein [Candidatus Limnocylindrales bacterium]
MKIEDVEGIGPDHAASLRGVGITTTDALLERGATAAGRAELATTAGVSPKLVLEWVNHVDLMRIDGVGSEYSDLLEAAGVDSPAELAQRNAANLAQTFQELDAARPDWIRSVPSVATVEGWIAQAKALPQIVSHGGGGASGTGEAVGPHPGVEQRRPVGVLVPAERPDPDVAQPPKSLLIRAQIPSSAVPPVADRVGAADGAGG